MIHWIWKNLCVNIFTYVVIISTRFHTEALLFPQPTKTIWKWFHVIWMIWYHWSTVIEQQKNNFIIMHIRYIKYSQDIYLVVRSLNLATKPPSCFLSFFLSSKEREEKNRIEKLVFATDLKAVVSPWQLLSAVPSSSSFSLTPVWWQMSNGQPHSPTRPRASTINNSHFQIFLRTLKSAKINFFF